MLNSAKIIFYKNNVRAKVAPTVEKRLELKDAFSFSRLTAPAPSLMEPKKFESTKIIFYENNGRAMLVITVTCVER